MIPSLCKSIFIFRVLGQGQTPSWLFVRGTRIGNSSPFCQGWILLPRSGEIRALKAFPSLGTAPAQYSSAHVARLRSEQKTTSLISRLSSSPQLVLRMGKQQGNLADRGGQGTSVPGCRGAPAAGKLGHRPHPPLGWLLISVQISALQLTSCVSLGT